MLEGASACLQGVGEHRYNCPDSRQLETPAQGTGPPGNLRTDTFLLRYWIAL